MGSEVNTELVGEDAQSRFQVYERPHIFPGRCLVCGAVDRPVVDFGASADFEGIGYGTAMFCVLCITQAALKFPENRPKVVVPELNEKDYTRLVDGLKNAVGNVVDNWTEHLVTIVPDDGPVSRAEDPKTESSNSSRSKSSSGKSAKAPDGPSVSEGPASLSSGSFGGFSVD